MEREATLGGWVGRFGEMYPHGKNGRALIAELIEGIRARPAITVFTEAEIASKSGSFGNYEVGIRVGGADPQTLSVAVGSIVVATGFDTLPAGGGRIRLRHRRRRDAARVQGGHRRLGGPARLARQARADRRLRVLRRQPRAADEPGANQYCSRFCCAATVAASVQLASRDAQVHQYHLYRDMRTYGKYELMYTESRKLGSVYLKFADDAPPAVARDASGQLTVTVRDLLTGGEEVAIPTDLVVLVTGMIPRRNEEMVGVLKLPLGRDGFFNEIHPKLRPVETVVDGVYIAGACQGPRNSSESVASGLAAVTQSAAILKKGFAELDPHVATVDTAACTACGPVRGRLPLRRHRDDHPGGAADRRHQRDRLQGLRRVRAGLPGERDRPARLHQRPGHGDDRQPAGGPGRMSAANRELREIVREEPVMRPPDPGPAP